MAEEQDEPQFKEEERVLRQNAVDYACASVALEGFKLSADELAHAQRYVNGELSLAEFLKPAALSRSGQDQRKG
jgi:hypothetical protein